MGRNLIDIMSKEDRERYGDLIMPVDTDISIDKVILSDENKAKLDEFLREYKFREKLMKYNLRPMNRLLFYGASGTGKTFLTKALSNYMGMYMLYVDIAKSLSEDTVADNISNIFAVADKYKNCIIFFDECDSIAWNRDSKDNESGTRRRATNSIFQQLDQMSFDNIFVSCTNMIRRLDPAFERRFDMKFEFRRPDKDIKEIIYKFLHEEFLLDPDVSERDYQAVQKRSTLSYYEYQIIVERNMKKAVMDDNFAIKLSDILNDISITIGSKRRFGTDVDDEATFKSGGEL